MPYKIIPSPERSELQKFAMSFHQDFDLEDTDYFEGARRYVSGLSPKNRQLLAEEMRVFMDENATRSSRSLKKFWVRLGSIGGWQPDVEIHEGLERFYHIIIGD